MKKVTVVDYGVGNILSIQRAFEHLGCEVDTTADAREIASASYLVLPGVGAFARGIQKLKESNLVEAIQSYCLQDKPFLGICLGMQMMLEVSEEFSLQEGFGFIKGRVVAIPKTTSEGERNKIPHIGWNEVHGNQTASWNKTILKDLPEGSFFYFVHSFYTQLSDSRNCLAYCVYNGQVIPAVISSGNLYGCQFHPEKSGELGLQILKNFINLN